MLTVRPGTTLHEIDMLLAGQGQCLLFEPASYAPLYGKDPAKTTIGGVVGANLSGPRRFRSGAARDHVLAVRGVSARGEIFKGGGKVVKNVTGYDIPKLIAGAYGTLGNCDRAHTESDAACTGGADGAVRIFGFDGGTAIHERHRS